VSLGLGPVKWGLHTGTLKDSACRRRWDLAPIQAVEVNVRAVDDLAFSQRPITTCRPFLRRNVQSGWGGPHTGDAALVEVSSVGL
jgi:hypothetical protein